MAKRQPTYEVAVADEVLRSWSSQIDALTQQLGDAPNTKRLSDREELDLYWFTDERYQDASALVMAGYSPEEATGMKHPYRFRFLQANERPPDQQVSLAKRMNREAELARAEGWTPPIGVPKGTVIPDLLRNAAGGPSATPHPTPTMPGELAPGVPMPPGPMPMGGGPAIPGQPPMMPPPGVL